MEITELLKGNLEGCVLAIINHEPTYGYQITQRLNQLGFTDIVEGTVYTVLIRLERGELVTIEKRPSTQGPMRKFYSLNSNGQAQLKNYWEKWEYMSSKINLLKEETDELN